MKPNLEVKQMTTQILDEKCSKATWISTAKALPGIGEMCECLVGNTIYIASLQAQDEAHLVWASDDRFVVYGITHWRNQSAFSSSDTRLTIGRPTI